MHAQNYKRHVVAELPSQSIDELEAGLSTHERSQCDLVKCGGNVVNHCKLLAKTLSQFKVDSRDTGSLLIRGLPLGSMPQTPLALNVRLPQSHRSGLLVHGVSEYLGQLLAYEAEADAVFIQDIYPVGADATLTVNSGSTLFNFHSENAHHDIRPSYLGLMCLRSDSSHQALTMFAHVQDICGSLEPDVIEALLALDFRTRFSLSFSRGQTQPIESMPHTVVSRNNDGLEIRYNSHNTRALSSAGDVALTRLLETAHNCHSEVELQYGDLLIIDNRVVVHGRTGFAPRFDGTDRWLRRFYLYTGHLAERYRSGLGVNIVSR